MSRYLLNVQSQYSIHIRLNIQSRFSVTIYLSLSPATKTYYIYYPGDNIFYIISDPIVTFPYYLAPNKNIFHSLCNFIIKLYPYQYPVWHILHYIRMVVYFKAASASRVIYFITLHQTHEKLSLHRYGVKYTILKFQIHSTNISCLKSRFSHRIINILHFMLYSLLNKSFNK